MAYESRQEKRIRKHTPRTVLDMETAGVMVMKLVMIQGKDYFNIGDRHNQVIQHRRIDLAVTCQFHYRRARCGTVKNSKSKHNIA